MAQRQSTSGADPEKPHSCVEVKDSKLTLIEDLECSHDEADHRIIYHVNWLVLVRQAKVVVVAFDDTDILVMLLFHFWNSWQAAGLAELWQNKGSGTSRRVYPLHLVVERTPDVILQNLMAYHALTGNDTNSKIESKT